MYKAHSLFKSPSEDQKLWRYTDFTKYIDFLISQSLYFSTPDRFEDPFEGSLPIRSADERSKHEEFFPSDYMSDLAKELKKNNFGINCWHMSDYESSAMWKLYLRSNEGIAVQTTFGKLKNCFAHTDTTIHIGMVNYIDYIKDYFPPEKYFAHYLHKRKSFEHEKEIRAIILRNEDGNIFDLSNGGVNIKINIYELVEKIYLRPQTPIWTSNLIKETTKRLGFEFKIETSDLDRSPIF